MLRWHMAVTTAVLGSLAVTALLWLNGPGPTETTEAASFRGAGSGRGRVTFTTSGTPVGGLYPGATRNIRLTLTNPYRYDVQVEKLDGTLTSTSSRLCLPNQTNLLVRRYTGRLPFVLRAEQTKTVETIPVYMPPSVDDGCQRTTFTVRIRGTATKIGR